MLAKEILLLVLDSARARGLAEGAAATVANLVASTSIVSVNGFIDLNASSYISEFDSSTWSA